MILPIFQIDTGPPMLPDLTSLALLRHAVETRSLSKSAERMHITLSAASRHISLLEIGRANVCTPVTNAKIVCRLMLEKKLTILSQTDISEERLSQSTETE